MKKFLVHYFDNESETIQGTEMQISGPVIAIFNSIKIVAIIPLERIVRVVESTSLLEDSPE